MRAYNISRGRKNQKLLLQNSETVKIFQECLLCGDQLQQKKGHGSFLPFCFWLPPPPPEKKNVCWGHETNLKTTRGYKPIFVTVCGLLFSILITIWFFPCNYYKEMNHYKNCGTRVSCKGKLAQEIMKWQYENSVLSYPLPSPQEKNLSQCSRSSEF